MPCKNGATPDSVLNEIGGRKVVSNGERNNRRSFSCPHEPPQVWALRYGSARAPIVSVVPDKNMWQLAWPDGQLSGICNLSRARDAAVAICAIGGRDRRRLHWKIYRPKTPAEAPPVPPDGGAAP